MPVVWHHFIPALGYMKIIKLILIINLLNTSVSSAMNSKDTLESKHYQIKWKVDLPVFAISTSALWYGMTTRNNKPKVSHSVITNLNPDNLHSWEKNATTQKNDYADPISDGIFVGGVLFPALFYVDSKVREHGLPYTVMYLQVMSITGMGYSLAASQTNKLRPYAYNSKFSLEQRTSNNATFSFYAGHPSMVAAGTFFAASVFNELHPDSWVRYPFYGIAATSTLLCGYYRYIGGYHFISDLAAGIGIGTAVGILVPHLHKNKGRLKTGMSGINQVSIIYALR